MNTARNGRTRTVSPSAAWSPRSWRCRIRSGLGRWCSPAHTRDRLERSGRPPGRPAGAAGRRRPCLPLRAAGGRRRGGTGVPGRRGAEGVNGAPEDVVGMAAEREGARRRGDFAAADALRARILEAGFAVTDTAAGPVLAPAEVMPPIRLRPHEVGGMLDRPAVFD